MADTIRKDKSAVVLKYPENAVAPFITAKGKGKLAEYIIEEARKNDIDVVENDVLVDLLSSEEIGSLIPENTWNAVASIFAFILEDLK